MADDIHHLVLGPFRDVVAKGNTALENARGANSQPMIKSAQSLVNNAERALNKIEPVCNKRLGEYGSNFIDALKENDEISGFREQLNDILWDLDDCIEVDGFDVEIYSRLQALLRGAALKISDIVVRMKLEHPQSEVAVSVTSGRSRAPSLVSPGSINVAEAKAGPVPTWEEDGEAVERREQQTEPVEVAIVVQPFVGEPPTIRLEDMPPQPSENPWQGKADNLASDIAELNMDVDDSIERRPRIEIGRQEDDLVSPLTPDNQTASHFFGRPNSASLFANHPRDSLVSPIDDEALNSPTNILEKTPSLASGESSYSMTAEHGSQQPAIPPIPPILSYQHSKSSPVSPQQRPPPGPRLPDSEGLIAVETELSPQSSHNSEPPPDCTIDQTSSFYQYKGFCEGATEVLRGGSGVKRERRQLGITAASATAVVAKCKKCMYELDWELVRNDLDKRDARDNYSMAAGAVSFRLRFLSKSHLAVRRVDENQVYGCLFCVRAGRTPREGDATVFFGQAALFSHLARHPRPLPFVPGVTVLYDFDGDGGEEFRNNYDMRFLKPPLIAAATGPDDRDGFIRRLPIAVASETFTALRAPPPDRATAATGLLPMLQFAVGARIVGIEFPARYGGEWATGWADGAKGVFPVDCVRLQPPRRQGDVVKASLPTATGGRGGSHLSAVARWKRVPPSMSKKDKELSLASGEAQWLKFDKGEVITGISFAHQGHWCWSGYNAKGKWGIFPRAFMEPATLLEEAPSNLLSLLHREGNKRGSGLGLTIGGSGGGMFSRIRGEGRRRLSSHSSTGGGVDRGGGGDEEHPPSPSGSYFSSAGTGSAGGSSVRSPRPSLY
ncbi:hypothetical protein B0H66DRAFT_602999 [Apodospora peruviana]|uniref:SH3 domain-containing protein n=1 Tax=Apodospora peruviana TaxID=516989 RepID=A0AAE0M5B0_9PEZI|nr:hypothetical protein B0H66DRAFT_602999 [Apodospora peruviana]